MTGVTQEKSDVERTSSGIQGSAVHSGRRIPQSGGSLGRGPEVERGETRDTWLCGPW